MLTARIRIILGIISIFIIASLSSFLEKVFELQKKPFLKIEGTFYSSINFLLVIDSSINSICLLWLSIDFSTVLSETFKILAISLILYISFFLKNPRQISSSIVYYFPLLNNFQKLVFFFYKLLPILNRP